MCITIDEIEKSEVSQMRQTAKAEAYIRFSQQLNTRAYSAAPRSHSGYTAPVAQKRTITDGPQAFKSMCHGRYDESKLSSMSPGFAYNQENRENSSCFATKSREFVVFCYEIHRNHNKSVGNPNKCKEITRNP